MARPAEDSEREVLEQFRESVRDELPKKQLKNDAYLLRWIRARNGNLENALLMFRTSMEWRKANNIDSVTFEKIPKYMNDYFNCHFGGIDKHGRPVICVPFGEWDLREIIDKGKKDELIRFLSQALEIFDHTMREMWKNQFPSKTKWQHTQFTVILDMKGFTYTKLIHKKTIDTILEMIKIYEANYPETLGAAVIINAPWIFSTLYGMIRPLLSELTASKIKIFDSKESSWKKAIEDLIESDEIPPRFGGSRIEYHPIRPLVTNFQTWIPK